MDNFKTIHNIETDITLQQKLKTITCLCFTRISGSNLVRKTAQTDFTAIKHSENDMVAVCVMN